MVVTPNIADLPYCLRNGVKCFELVAEPVQQELLTGLFIKGWGYNGGIPGPTIKVYPGDYVNIRVFNCLPEPTSVPLARHGRSRHDGRRSRCSAYA